MKLSFIFSIGFLFLSGCISKPNRQTVHAYTDSKKSITDYADYTMVNIVTQSRMPAKSLSDSGDEVEVATAFDGQNSEITFIVRNCKPELAVSVSAHDVSTEYRKQFIAIVGEISENGLSPLAEHEIRSLKLYLGGLVSSTPENERENELKRSVLQFRDNLFVLYKNLPAAE